MSTILEAVAVIKGKDATGNAFDTVANKINRLARAANALSRDVSKQLTTAKHAEVATTRLNRASHAVGGGLKAAAGAAAAYEGSRAVRALAEHTVKSAANRGHEEVRMAASGMSEEEIKDSRKLASNLSGKFKSLSQTEIEHTTRNVRSVVGSFEEASHILEPLMKLRVVAEGAHPERAAELGEDFDKLIKGMEIKGVTQDLGKFNHYIDGMAKALNVFGDTLRPTDYYEMFKYGRAATNALSDDFMLKTAPTLAQELGGSSAGKALSSFYTQFVGGKMSNKAVASLDEYGLLDPKKVIKTKTGSVKGVMPGGVAGAEYLRPGETDPYMWVNKVLLPALAKKGVTDPSQIQEVIAAIASQTTTAQMMSIFATQQARIEKDQALVHGAEGMSAADRFQRDDPMVAKKAIESQFDNLLGNTAEPLLPKALQGMNWLSSTLNAAADEAKKNPARSAAGLAWGAGTIGALGLDGAASTFGVAGSLFRGEPALEGMRFGLTRLMMLLAPILDIATRPDVLSAKDFGERGVAIQQALDEYHSHDAERRTEADKRAAERDARISEWDNRAATGGMPAVPFLPYSMGDMRAATGAGGAPDALSREPAKAEVVGNATLDVKVEVSPSADFLTRVDQRVDNKINAFRSSGAPATGSTGSTGRSMPEARAPQ